MDSHNLATLFGPNVLHRARAVNEKQFMAECAEQAEQSAEVISVVKDMIDNHYDLFEVHWTGVHTFFVCFFLVILYLQHCITCCQDISWDPSVCCCGQVNS